MTEPTGDAVPLDPPPPIVAWEAPSDQVGPAPGVEFAPHGSRFVAYVLDSVLIFILVLGVLGALIVVGNLIGSDVSRPRAADPDVYSLFALVAVVVVVGGIVVGYFPFFWARGGQTPGMKPFRLWVVRDQDGQPISGRKAILRWIGMTFVSASVFYLGFIWIFVDKRRRGWHDLIAGTVVVHRMKGRSST